MSGHMPGPRGDDKSSPDKRRSMMRRGPGRMGSVEKAKDVRGALLRLLNYLKPYRLHIAFVVTLTILGTAASLMSPYLMGVAIDKNIIPGDMDGLLQTSLRTSSQA